MTSVFQPTRPLRGATRGQGRGVGRRKFQPTRPLRGATGADCTGRRTTTISTHAPLAGRDSSARSTATRARRNFNPRAPCGARLWPKIESATAKAFQPTRPLRGATRKKRTPRRWHVISTHAPLAGRDSKSVQITMHIFAITDKFQMLLHRMPPVRAFCSFLTQENHADLGANRPSDLCALVLRTIRSSVPRADTSACSRSVRFYSRTSCPSSKIEGCPFLGQ